MLSSGLLSAGEQAAAYVARAVWSCTQSTSGNNRRFALPATGAARCKKRFDLLIDDTLRVCLESEP